VRYLLLAVWILASAGAASADWNEVMNTLERATRGTRYDIGADPSEPGWVATQKARFDSERARRGGADLEAENRPDPVSCRESKPGGSTAHCD
jgi:hypothetical protein